VAKIPKKQEIWLTLDGLGSIISRMEEIEVAIGKLDDFKFQGLTPLFPFISPRPKSS